METIAPADGPRNAVRLNEDYIRSVQVSDVQRFKEILADDFLCSLPDGSLIDRARFLEQTARPVTICEPRRARRQRQADGQFRHHPRADDVHDG